MRPKREMMSIRELSRKYSAMLKQLEGEDFMPYYLNYVCPNGHKMKSVVQENGTTPFKLTCQCGAVATSTTTDHKEHSTPEYEWVRPTMEECLRMRKKGYSQLNHVLAGGLELKYIDYHNRKKDDNNQKSNEAGA